MKPTRCTNFSNLTFGIKLYMFRTDPLSIIRSFSLYTQKWCMSYSFVGNCVTYTIYHCYVYREKLMMDKGTVRNM